MKTTTILKLKRNLIGLSIGILALAFSSPLQSQVVRDHRTKKETDPYTRLKNEAKKTAVQKSRMSPIEISQNDPNWKGKTKAAIKFVPFKLEDKKGNPIPPNRKVTLKNGKVITALQLLNETNALEKKLNSKGYSLRINDEKVVSRTVTDTKFLDGRRSLAPKSIGAFKKEAEVKKFMSLERQVQVAGPSFNGRSQMLTLKPYSSYTQSERDQINKYDFSKVSGKVIAQKTTKRRPFKDFRTKRIGNLAKLYEINKTNNKNWGFGNPDTFRANLEGSITRFAKIYPFDPQNTANNKSEFRVKATSKATGSLLGKSIDILNASCQFHAPSNVSKKMSATISVKALEMNLFPPNSTTFSQQKSFSKTYGRSFDKSFPLRVPILPGLDFVGLIGVKGEVGFEYEAKIERTVASVHAKPLIDLKVYGEGGLSLIGVFEGGVEAELTFIKGELDLNAFAGIFSQNSENIVVGVNHYFGYDIEILSGTISAYGEACSPIDIPFIDDCYRKEHELFKWDGFKDSGTITEGGFEPFTLKNIAKYDETPVFTQE
ncbi:hypothetical protein R3X28_10840 [Maribacter sp. TH_r10]|uniref:hypothetical protein n=1 Tax=Maribacter sp. TH_r10 TaxID=3082086 RepID=UPI002955D2F9|nr:hypothetical protein [Maribacter sp. TH_r10]MDV7139376.1 hypothetical protein [Maribacter sp. TH_r10]